MQRSDFGFKFLPKDDELVLGYLLKKVNGEPLPSADVVDCEIYGDKEPWKIFGKTSKKSYVFTKLNKKGKGKKIERRVGCGTWKGQNTNPVKDSQNNHVGYKKLFVFEVKGSDSNNADNRHWLMHEYSLVHAESDYVLCAIRNKHGIDAVDDDEPEQKRTRFNENEQNSFTEAATPASILASDEALGFVAASNAFTEQTRAYTLASDHEALGFVAAANAFTEPTAAYSFASEYQEALTGFAAASNAFTEPTPAYSFASEYQEALTGFAAASNAFTEPAPTYTFTSDHEALGFAAASNAFTEPTPVYTFASECHGALTGFVATSNCEDGTSTNGRFAVMSEESYRDLYEAEEARQVLISNKSIQDVNAFQQQSMVRFSNKNAMEDMQTTAAESIYTSVSVPAMEYINAGVFQQQSMVTFSNNNAIEDMQTTAAESIYTSVSVPAMEYINAGVSAPALDFDSAASAMASCFAAESIYTSVSVPGMECIIAGVSAPALDFDSAASAMTSGIAAEPTPAPTLPSDEVLTGFAAATNAFTETTQACTFASDHEALIGLDAASSCEDHEPFSSERFAIPLAALTSKEFDRDLFEAEDARQVLIPNESVQATVALELNRSFQQQSMERFNNSNVMEDVQTSLTTAAESRTLESQPHHWNTFMQESQPHTWTDSRPTAIAFDVGAAPALEFDAGLPFSDLGDMSFLDMLTSDDL